MTKYFWRRLPHVHGQVLGIGHKVDAKYARTVPVMVITVAMPCKMHFPKILPQYLALNYK